MKFYQLGEAGDRLYQVVDFLEGCSLDLKLQEGTLPLDDFRTIFTQVIDALHYAAAHDIVHRDVKPANIFLCRQPGENGALRAVLLDFGIVHRIEDKTLTATRAILGSPLYMSPEQCRGADVDCRSDIYSLACTMYEALCGSPPFTGGSAAEVIMKHMRDSPPHLPATVGKEEMDTELAQLLRLCLSKDPEGRPQTFDELAKKFHEAVDALPSGVTFSKRASRKSNNMAIFQLVSAAIATLLLLVTLALMMQTRLDLETDEARIERAKAALGAAISSGTDSKIKKARSQLHRYVLAYTEQLLKDKEYDKAIKLLQDIIRFDPLSYSNGALSHQCSIAQRKKAQTCTSNLEKQKFIDDAFDSLKNAVTAYGFVDTRAAIECNMEYVLFLIEQRKLHPAYQHFKKIRINAEQRLILPEHHDQHEALAKGARQLAAALETQARCRSDYSEDEKLLLCDFFLQICDLFYEAGHLEMENAYRKAKHWFDESEKQCSNPSCAHRSVDELSEKLEFFAQLKRDLKSKSSPGLKR